jgi:hypothetical protein
MRCRLNNSRIVVLLILACAPLARGQATHTPFVTVLLRNWSAWDQNGDGTLSRDEIQRVVLDPSVKGEDAAAAAALKLLSRRKIDPPPALTLAYFKEYDRIASSLQAPSSTAAAEARTVDTAGADSVEAAARSAKVPCDWDLYFAASLHRITIGGPEKGTGERVEPAIEAMRQGPLGDCFFVASMGSMVVHRPELLQSILNPLPDGSYRVEFPNASPIHVQRPTDAQLAISSISRDEGVWLAVMEQAFGKYRSILKGKGADVDGTDVLRLGGDSAPTIALLTGHAARRIRCGVSVEDRRANAPQVLPELRDALVEAIASHRLITAGVNPPAELKSVDGKPAGTLPKLPPNISKNHVYAVVGYDRATDIVEIWNPHGQMFTPKGPPGLENGYPTDHGRFKLPLADACKFYTSFTFETDAPAKEQAAGTASAS